MGTEATTDEAVTIPTDMAIPTGIRMRLAAITARRDTSAGDIITGAMAVGSSARNGIVAGGRPKQEDNKLAEGIQPAFFFWG